MSITVGERVAQTGGRTTGFDYLRLGLATGVIVAHSVLASYGHLVNKALVHSPARPFILIILPMFFALSGFLVAGSLLRSKTLVMFMGLRVIRIFPALGMEVLLSALILGPIFTTLPLSAYFSDPLFHRYFFNLIGHVQFDLPGVFAHNPVPFMINSQLWTVPYEFYCYFSLMALGLAGVVRRRFLVLVGALGLQAAHFGVDLLYHPAKIFGEGGANAGGINLIVSFLLGVSIYLYRDKIRWSAKLFWLCLAASLILLIRPFGEFLAVVPIAYVTAYLGLLNPAKLPILRGADYSYGLYLYGMVIEQAMSALGVREWWLNSLLSLALACAFAAVSWRFVEKPALGLRKHLVTVEAAWLQFQAQFRRTAAARSPAE